MKPLLKKVDAGDTTLQEFKKLLHRVGHRIVEEDDEGPKKEMVDTTGGQLAAVTVKVDAIKDAVDAIKDAFEMHI